MRLQGPFLASDSTGIKKVSSASLKYRQLFTYIVTNINICIIYLYHLSNGLGYMPDLQIFEWTCVPQDL